MSKWNLKIILLSFYLFVSGMAPTTILGQQVSEKTYPVDKLTYQIDFALFWDYRKYKKTDFSFSLISPTGKKIDEDNAKQLGVEVLGSYDPDASFRAYRVPGPGAGLWTMVVGHPSDAHFTFSPLPYSELKLNWDFTQKNPLLNEPLILQATLTEPELVKGSLITAKITRYKEWTVESSSFDLVMVDNGTGNDKEANDGIYTATLLDTSVQGSYCADIYAEGTAPTAGPFQRSDGHCTFVATQYSHDHALDPNKRRVPPQEE